MRPANPLSVVTGATGGIGGAHRESHPWDISADLIELARTPVTVVCAGAKSILDIFLEVVALEYYTVASELPHLIGRFFSTHDIQRFHSCQLRELDDVLSHGGVGGGLTDPVTGHQGNVSAEEEIGGNRIDSEH